MKIVAAASAFPDHVYSQQQIASALKEIWSDQIEHPERLERLHSYCGVERRHL